MIPREKILDEPIPGTSRISDLQQIARDCAGQGEAVRFCVVRGLTSDAP